jgi:hypothetical protein
MEDSISTIIYIVIFVLIAIFNVVASNKKKAAEKEKRMKQMQEQKNMTPQPQPKPVSQTYKTERPKSLEDFLKNVLGQEEPAKAPQKPAYEPIETPYYESFEPVVEVKKAKVAEKIKESNKTSKTITGFSYDKKSDEQLELEEDQFVLKIRKGEFDVKEAVLYSEILNKKF